MNSMTAQSASECPIRVLIVDDHPLVRDGLKARLSHAENIRISGEAGDGFEALRQIEELTPDVVLLDISMPKMNGIDTAEAIHDRYPNVLILVLSMHDDREYVVNVIRAGASGYVLKSASAEEMLQAIKAVYNGGNYYSPSVAAKMLDPVDHPADSLTSREQTVLRLLAGGASNKAMAAQLDISVRTVETHRRNIKQKLNITSTGALIRYALDYGLVDLE